MQTPSLPAKLLPTYPFLPFALSSHHSTAPSNPKPHQPNPTATRQSLIPLLSSLLLVSTDRPTSRAHHLAPCIVAVLRSNSSKAKPPSSVRASLSTILTCPSAAPRARWCCRPPPASTPTTARPALCCCCCCCCCTHIPQDLGWLGLLRPLRCLESTEPRLLGEVGRLLLRALSLLTANMYLHVYVRV
ncbi:uncharacterized protein IWZ02DRAFT_89326 [Phyllosticta citriasiana]|uniref:uncharacterized protein n=1 Tax=Phyllosticta citriasiana TaxID=595635 RepID=UPI0030FDCA58